MLYHHDVYIYTEYNKERKKGSTTKQLTVHSTGGELQPDEIPY
jgi:hypothetical protein